MQYVRVSSRYTSLQPNSINMLSLLIESKIRLPQCAPAPNRSAKRELLRAQGERDFFLGIVREVATDLDLKSLSQKTVDNLAVLLDADGASLFLVDGPRGGRQSLVSKVTPLCNHSMSSGLEAGNETTFDARQQIFNKKVYASFSS